MVKSAEVYSSSVNTLATKNKKSKSYTQIVTSAGNKDKTQKTKRRFTNKSTVNTPTNNSAASQLSKKSVLDNVVKKTKAEIASSKKCNQNIKSNNDLAIQTKLTSLTAANKFALNKISRSIPLPAWKQREQKKKSEQTVRLLSDRIIYNQLKYEQLKEFVNDAIQRKKIFTLYGKCRVIRQALKERGWIEKLTYRSFDNLKRELPFSEHNSETERKTESIIINNLILKNNTNFIWLIRGNEKIIQSSNLYRCPLINRIKMDDKYFTTKAGLCSALKYQHWFNINGVSDVSTPRSYNIFDTNELEDFQIDYRITSCTNLLKWFIKNKEDDTDIICEDGKIQFSTVFFALKRCQAYIQCKQHKDIDKLIKEPKPNEWDAFIDNYHKLVFKKQKLKVEHRNVVEFYLICSKEIIKFMKKYRPEIDCEGFNNIWIIKPGSWSRGRGITVTNNMKTILHVSTRPRVQKYVIQKYLESPLLIYGTKFDIRQYYMISNTHPLVIWMYKNCYLRFSSQTYSLVSFHESIHLTNNAIQHKYKNNKRRNANLPENNMWILKQFTDYLESFGHAHVWEKIIYQGMKKNIIGAMLNCQDGMINRINQFELYGCDFILDNNYKPWLIEINSCPDMSASTRVTAQICPQVMEDIIKVVVDYKRDPKALTGDFECIYRQKMTPPIYTTDISSLVICGEDSRNDKSKSTEAKPQYKEACTNENLRTTLLWKHELIKLQSEEEFLKHELIKTQSDEETMVYKYSEDSMDKENIPSDLRILQSQNDLCSSTNISKENISSEMGPRADTLKEEVEYLDNADSPDDSITSFQMPNQESSVTNFPTVSETIPYFDFVINNEKFTESHPKSTDNLTRHYSSIEKFTPKSEMYKNSLINISNKFKISGNSPIKHKICKPEVKKFRYQSDIFEKLVQKNVFSSRNKLYKLLHPNKKEHPLEQYADVDNPYQDNKIVPDITQNYSNDELYQIKLNGNVRDISEVKYDNYSEEDIARNAFVENRKYYDNFTYPRRTMTSRYSSTLENSKRNQDSENKLSLAKISKEIHKKKLNETKNARIIHKMYTSNKKYFIDTVSRFVHEDVEY